MPAPPPARLILASRSPQRRAILAKLGLDFEVRPSGVPEREKGDDPRELAVENALAKARAVAGEDPAQVVLGVDTVVWLDGRIFGKPADLAQAAEGLKALSGATHVVVSGVALIRRSAPATAPTALTATAETRVAFRQLDDATLRWYLQTGEWRERAGGYAIQGAGAALVSHIEGDYENVVGLPLAALLELWPDLLTAAATPRRSPA